MAKPEKKSLPEQTIDPRTIRKRFLQINRERLLMARNSLRIKKRVFVDVLPLLFHINHPALPGFVSREAPYGIADYSPNQQVLNAAATINSEFYFQRRAMRIYDIQALYMIGSSGTIAYSEKSDFDIWICYRKQLDKKQLRLLNEKCELIRQWAEALGLEVTFFVLNDESFKSGKMQALSNESSGSAQFSILLEEFYRTALLLAGKYPAWWLVPPEDNVDYNSYLQQLNDTREILDYEYLDFGNLTEIPANEFIGAALWQLNKAINSPHKSLLKLILIESYAAEFPHMELLCTRYKREVYNGNVDLSKLDPYVMMNNKVEEYLKSLGETERCELARRCFYFKVNKKLSKLNPNKINKQHEMILSLVKEWNWDSYYLEILDSRATWKLTQVKEEKITLVKELTRSYRMLSDFARKNTEDSLINKEDLNLLGRRLYAAFERKAGKLELINPDVSSDLIESRLSFVVHQSGERKIWLLYNSEFEEAKQLKTNPIIRAQSMVELISWGHFNQIIGPHSLVTLHKPNGILDSRELLAIIDCFKNLYPEHRISKPDIETMRQTAHLKEAIIFVNVGDDPFSAHTQLGMHFTSNRSDALSYGGFWKNLANVFDMMVINNWGEIINSHFRGPSAVMDCLINLLEWSPLDSRYKPPTIKVFSYTSSHGPSVAKRIQEFFNDIIKVFYESSLSEYLRYIVNVGSVYFLLKTEKAQIQYKKLKNEIELYRELGAHQEDFTHIQFDRYTLSNTPLPIIVKYNKPNTVQMFFEIINENATIWVLDEKGSIFNQIVTFHSKQSLLSHYSKFLSTAVLRCNAIEHASNLDHAINPNIEYFQIQKNRQGKHQLKVVSSEIASGTKDYFSLQVIGDLSGGEESVYSLFCDGVEFSSLEYGDEVIRHVARHVLKHRANGERYPIYITDLEVSRNIFKQRDIPGVQTTHYLNYKKAIEVKLNKALEDL